MKTDQFIDLLSTNLEPADHGKTSRLLATAVLLGVAAAIGGFKIGAQHVDELIGFHERFSFAMSRARVRSPL